MSSVCRVKSPGVGQSPGEGDTGKVLVTGDQESQDLGSKIPSVSCPRCTLGVKGQIDYRGRSPRPGVRPKGLNPSHLGQGTQEGPDKSGVVKVPSIFNTDKGLFRESTQFGLGSLRCSPGTFPSTHLRPLGHCLKSGEKSLTRVESSLGFGSDSEEKEGRRSVVQILSVGTSGIVLSPSSVYRLRTPIFR